MQTYDLVSSKRTVRGILGFREALRRARTILRVYAPSWGVSIIRARDGRIVRELR